jgi:hypothetical protein
MCDKVRIKQSNSIKQEYKYGNIQNISINSKLISNNNSSIICHYTGVNSNATLEQLGSSDSINDPDAAAYKSICIYSKTKIDRKNSFYKDHSKFKTKKIENKIENNEKNVLCIPNVMMTYRERTILKLKDTAKILKYECRKLYREYRGIEKERSKLFTNSNSQTYKNIEIKSKNKYFEYELQKEKYESIRKEINNITKNINNNI